MSVIDTYLPEGAGPCAKATVVAVMVTKSGKLFKSTNFCYNPQTACPRDTEGYESGEGYHLCQDVCHQPAHAEVNVIAHAQRCGEDTTDSTIHVDYCWICDNCKAVSAKNGVSSVMIGAYKEEV